jgi:hypothetical protein
MSLLSRRQSLLLAGVLARSALTPAAAQTSRATDPDAAVPETRYQPAHVLRAPAAERATTATPDRLWHEHNRIVAGQPGHAGHGKPAPDPHAHHHNDAPAPAQPNHEGHH